MTLADIKDVLGCQIISGETLVSTDNTDIKWAFASDLMSDVLMFAKPGALLLTGLSNNHAVRTGKVAAVNAIVFVRGKTPDAAAVSLAEEYNIPLLAAGVSMFDACGALHAGGLRGVSSG